MTLEEARQNIGAGVVYCPDGAAREDGTIVAVSSAYVFVQYVGDRGSKATAPEHLTLLAHKAGA